MVNLTGPCAFVPPLEPKHSVSFCVAVVCLCGQGINSQIAKNVAWTAFRNFLSRVVGGEVTLLFAGLQLS
jgi:hypothetical protein